MRAYLWNDGLKYCYNHFRYCKVCIAIAELRELQLGIPDWNGIRVITATENTTDIRLPGPNGYSPVSRVLLYHLCLYHFWSLPLASLNKLNRFGINSVGIAKMWGELPLRKNFGVKTAKELSRIAGLVGVSLNPEIPNPHSIAIPDFPIVMDPVMHATLP